MTTTPVAPVFTLGFARTPAAAGPCWTNPESPSRSPGEITVCGFLPQGSSGPLQGLRRMPADGKIEDGAGPQMVTVQFVQPEHPFAVEADCVALQEVIAGGGVAPAGGMGV